MRRTEGDDQRKNEIVRKRRRDTDATRGGLIRRTARMKEYKRMVEFVVREIFAKMVQSVVFISPKEGVG